MNQYFKNNFFRGIILFWLVGGILILTTDKLTLHKCINGFNSNFLDLVTPFATHIGDGLFAIALSVLIFFFDKKNAVLLFLSFLISAGITQFLKQVVFSDAMRPMYYFQNDDCFHIVHGITIHTQNSFPSGHATTCFAIFGILTLIYSQKKYLEFLFFICVLFFSFTRVYLSQHFFEDVYAGSFVGTLTTCIVWQIKDKISFLKKL